MIISAKFDGDNDLDFIRQQHDAYSTAIGLIVYKCFDYFERSAEVTKQIDQDIIQRISQRRNGFDHRTIQNCHDLMAGYWRWKFKRQEPYLEGMASVTVKDWLDWIPKEIDDWFWSDPSIIGCVTYAASFQNEDQGYKAEENLVATLELKYSAMFETK